MRQTSQHYGCHNRRPFVNGFVAQNGVWTDGHALTPKAVEIKTFGSRECQYTLTALGQADGKTGRCQGCCWRRQPNGGPWKECDENQMA